MMAAKNAGFRVVLLSYTEGPFTRLVEKNGIKVYIVSCRSSFCFHRIPAAVKILKNEKIDLIHTNDWVTGNILMCVAAIFRGVPVIWHMHLKNYFSKNFINRIFVTMLDNLAALTCKKIIAVSEATKKDLVQQGYPGSMIEVIYTAPAKVRPASGDRTWGADLLREFGIPEGSAIFLHAGRLCPSKGQAELIEAMRYILEEEPNAYCLIAGEDQRPGGTYKRVLEEKLVTDRMKQKIKLLDFRWEIDNLIAVSRAVVLPSYEEGFPLILLEAMKNKKPVIAFTTDGLKEAMLKTIKDPSKAEKMGLNGFNLLREKFDNEKYVKRILSIYEDIAPD
jgi:glycosyltransferase involved in cell wall biosynthesis